MMPHRGQPQVVALMPQPDCWSMVHSQSNDIGGHDGIANLSCFQQPNRQCRFVKKVLCLALCSKVMNPPPPTSPRSHVCAECLLQAQAPQWPLAEGGVRTPEMTVSASARFMRLMALSRVSAHTINLPSSES